MANDQLSTIVDKSKELLIDLTALGISSQTIAKIEFEQSSVSELISSRNKWEEIVALVIGLNPAEVSRSLVTSRILFHVLGPALEYTDSRENFEDDLAHELSLLASYSVTRTMHLPIVHLALDSTKSFTFGSVTFRSILESDQQEDWWKRISVALGGFESHVDSYAELNVSGDLTIAINSSILLVLEHLLYFRGICFPISIGPLAQISLVGSYSIPGNIPIRIENPVANHSIEYRSTLIEQMGYFPEPHYLSKLTKGREPYLLQTDQIIKAEGTGKSDLQQRVLQGLRWLGDSTLPGEIAFRFLKVCLALEALLGGGGSDDYLIAKGITATLAERSAFVAGDSKDERVSIDQRIKTYYRRRSDLVHGKAAYVLPEEFLDFANLVRQICFSLLVKTKDFKTIDELQVWITSRRYE